MGLLKTEATVNDSDENDLTFSMEMKRKPEYYEDFAILPVVLMVVLGWFSFFIDRSAVPARVTMTTFGFLTIMNFLSSQLATLPRIGAKKSWLLRFMLVSLIFCFYAVVEYIFVNYLYRVERRTDKIQEKAAQHKKRRIAIEMDKQTGCRVVAFPQDTVVNNKPENGLSEKKFEEYNIDNVRASKAEMSYFGLCKIDYLLLKQDGNMFFKDQHIDIFSRYAYPIIYTICCVVQYLSAK